MSVCRKEGKKKLKHIYPEGSNTCFRCGHTTTKGANFRRFDYKKALKAIKERMAEV